MITFHIGLHKTGTTYLQKEVFPQYRGCFVAPGSQGQPAAMLRHLAAASSREYRPGRVEQLVSDLDRRYRNVLLSREALSGRLWDDPVGTGRRTAARLAALKGDTQVIICIRRQDQMLRSVYAQYVRQGGIATPEEFLYSSNGQGYDPEHLEYDHLVEAYVNSLGRNRVKVVAYERLLKDPVSFAKGIAAFIGGRFDGRCSRRRRNRSLHGPTLDTLRRWNARFRRSRFNPSPPFRLPGARAIRYALQATQGKRRPSGKERGWSHHLSEAQLERYRKSNQRLEATFALGLEGLGYSV